MINRLFEKTHIPMIDQHWKMMWALKYYKSYKKFTRNGGEEWCDKEDEEE